MKLDQMFRMMIEVGRKADWRDEETLEEQLADRRRRYDALTGSARKFFDTERLWNPFGCSRICSGDLEADIRGMVVGVNPSLAGILYAERLRDSGHPVDAFLAHHGISPAGTIYEDINNTHYYVLRDFGVPQDTAREIVQRAICGYTLRQVGEPTSFDLNTDLALFNVHNPMDNLTGLYLSRVFERTAPRTVGDVVEALLSVEEFAIAARGGIPPMVGAGSAEAEAGAIYVDVHGGICLNDEELAALLATGNVGTVIRLGYGACRHVCEEAGANLILYPHNAHDSVGINLILDLIAAEDPIEVFPTDGFHRVERKAMTDFQWPEAYHPRAG